MAYSIPVVEQIMMYLRQVPVGRVKRQLRKAQDHGLDLDHLRLQSHFLAGGDIEDLIDALIFAKQHGMTLSTQTACAGQLMHAVENRRFTDGVKTLHAKGVKDVEANLTPF